MSLKRRRSSSPKDIKNSEDKQTDIFVSEAIEDRTSTFIAYFSPSIPPKELQKRPEIKSASHRMLAWRRRSSSQRTLAGASAPLESGHDDDGERYGGKRALSTLEGCKAEGSLVVARWYGGVMLGPIRFTHIEKCARDAITAWQRHEQGEVQKRRKLEEDREEKTRLVEELSERDTSIAALRKLLEEKTKSESTFGPTASQIEKAAPLVPQSRGVDYTALPVERLRMLDTARDRTIGWLLKQIDATEKQKAPPREQEVMERNAQRRSSASVDNVAANNTS